MTFALLRTASRPYDTAACWEDFLTPSECSAALDAAKALVHSPGGGCTHFIARQEAPACILESLALAVIDFHLANIGQDHGIGDACGAEWWVQIRQPDEPLSMHWDCDEYLKSEAGGEHVPPFLASVTYLTPHGAPTVVLPVVADAAGRAQAATPVDSADPLNKGFASHPLVGKHLAFDGRLLHGCPYDGPQTGEVAATAGAVSPEQLRVTILVNLWLGHRPHRVERLPQDLVSAVNAAQADAGEAAASSSATGADSSLQFRSGAAAQVPAVWQDEPQGEAPPAWREFSIGSFNHPPIHLRPLTNLWRRPPSAPHAHFIEYSPLHLNLAGGGDLAGQG